MNLRFSMGPFDMNGKLVHGGHKLKMWVVKEDGSSVALLPHPFTKAKDGNRCSVCTKAKSNRIHI